ncbi:MAG: nucleotidyltransferase domain-containing protein [Crenarchaeota archaeon]|nr:nucleotidyltransferase domain-containing protein [Thermoproteota archaeon]
MRRKALEAARRLLAALEREGIKIKEAYLFGSYARGDFLETSDVDLIVISEDWRGMRFLDRLELVYRLEWEEGITPWVEVLPLTPEEAERRSAVLEDARKYWIRVMNQTEADG